jgi:hypothetical protein
MTTSTISLSDLAGVTAEYLRTEVEVRISNVTRNVERLEEGSFDVTVTNAAAPRGIRLQDVTVHLQVDSAAVLTMSTSMSPLLQPRATGSRSAPVLPGGTNVSEMFIFFQPAGGGFSPDDVLDPGEVLELEIRFRGEGAGTTDLTAHIHATIAPEDLFPRTQGATTEKSITIRA